MPSRSLSAGGSPGRYSGQLTTPCAVAKLTVTSRLGAPLRTAATIRSSTESRRGSVAPAPASTDSYAAAAGCCATRAAGNGAPARTPASLAPLANSTPTQLSAVVRALPWTALSATYHRPQRGSSDFFG